MVKNTTASPKGKVSRFKLSFITGFIPFSNTGRKAVKSWVVTILAPIIVDKNGINGTRISLILPMTSIPLLAAYIIERAKSAIITSIGVRGYVVVTRNEPKSLNTSEARCIKYYI